MIILTIVLGFMFISCLVMGHKQEKTRKKLQGMIDEAKAERLEEQRILKDLKAYSEKFGNDPIYIIDLPKIQRMDFDQFNEYIEKCEDANLDFLKSILELKNLQNHIDMLEAYRNFKKVF